MCNWYIHANIYSPLLFFKKYFYRMIYVSFSPLFLFCDKKYTLKKVNSHILWLAIIDTIPLKRDTHSNISQQRCFLTAKKIFCLTGTRNTLVFPFKKQFSRQYLGFWLIYYLCNYLCLTSLHRKGYFVNFFNPWTYIHIAGCDYISTLQLFEIKLFTARFNGIQLKKLVAGISSHLVLCCMMCLTE